MLHLPNQTASLLVAPLNVAGSRHISYVVERVCLVVENDDAVEAIEGNHRKIEWVDRVRFDRFFNVTHHLVTKAPYRSADKGQELMRNRRNISQPALERFQAFDFPHDAE